MLGGVQLLRQDLFRDLDRKSGDLLTQCETRFLDLKLQARFCLFKRGLRFEARFFLDLAGKAPAFLYPREGMGRIGVIEVVKTAGDSLQANVLFNFRNC